MIVTMRMLNNLKISPAGAKKFFDDQGWDWADFIANGRDFSETDLQKIPHPFVGKIRKLK